MSDEQLILKAYEKWGEDCPEQIIGDFAFAVWDERLQKLFCARDHFGGSLFFFRRDAGRFLFASEPKGVLSFPKVEKKFNLKKLGVLLLPEPHTYLTDQSWFENIFPLEAGTAMTIDSGGIKTRRFWRPEIPAKQSVRENEILEAFRELIFEIIGARIDSDPPVVGLLSGGLDSSSIVGVAAQILARKNREIDVLAGVLAERNDPDFSDERYFIDRFAENENVRIHYVSAPEAGPFSGLGEFFTASDSPFITSRHYLYTAFQKEAERNGAETLLDGSFGETGPTFYGTGGFAEMFARFRWIRLWRELRQRKRLYNDSLRYNLRAEVINPVLPQLLVDLKRGKKNARDFLVQPHSLREDLARKLLNEIEDPPLRAERPAPDHRKNQLDEIIFMQKKMSEKASLNFSRSAVEVRYPLLDKRLVEFSLAAPVELKIKNGYSRHLMRAGLDGVLPPEIQWRTTKTPFSPDYVRRFNRQIGGVRNFLAEIKPADPIRQVLDLEKIIQWADLPVQDTERYTTNEKIAREYLPQAIYLIYFLRTFPDFQI